MTPNQQPTSKQVVAHMGLRAYRVALLVPGAHDWKLAARQAINVITSYWGGAGFVVVPVTSGELPSALLAALRAYDPDLVVVPPAGDSRLVVAPTDRALLHRAQQAISAACADYRIPIADVRAFVEPEVQDLAESCLSEGGLVPLTPLSVLVDEPSGATVGASPTLGGSLGLAAAARWGLADSPNGDDVDIDPSLLGRAVYRLVSCDPSSQDLAGVTTRDKAEGDVATNFDRTLFGLMSVHEARQPEYPAVLVVWGDEPADYSLAMAWDRTYGYGIWIADDWWEHKNVHSHVASAIDALTGNMLNAPSRPIIFTSTSLSVEELRNRLQECRQQATVFLGDLHQYSQIQPTIVAAHELVFPRFNKTHYAIQRRFSHEWSTTVRDDRGTIDFLMLPPVPDIGIPELQRIEDRAHWQVDLLVRDHNLPPTIAVPDREILAENQSAFATRIRSSRSGISFVSHRTDFVAAGTTVQQQLTRPLIRYPSLLKWADVRARVHGKSTRLSAAGAHAQLLATMLGARSALADLISGPLLAALQAFNTTGATSDAFRDGGGCVVNGEAFLKFQEICNRAGMDAGIEARDTIDELLHTGILHRGLITRCTVCTILAFTPIENVASLIRCQRCLSDIPLSRETWRSPVSEPEWFYDLHPTARILLRENGHVPLQLAHYLRSQSGLGFTDAPEFELLTSDGKSEVETDLLALADRQLIIAEAKTVNTFGTGQRLRTAARKRTQAAKIFVADEIVLATSQSSWEGATVTAVKRAIAKENWASGKAPRLRTIVGLGTGSVVDQIETASN